MENLEIVASIIKSWGSCPLFILNKSKNFQRKIWGIKPRQTNLQQMAITWISVYGVRRFSKL